MALKGELYQLIRSLSKSEKRYFRLFCTRESSGRNYLELFDMMDSQEVYDEDAIRKKFASRKFVQQLHVTKNYLRKLILKSLRNFHAGLSKDAELKDTLRNIEILYNKELYAQCETELKRAEALARHYELLTGMVDVKSWKRKLEQVMHPHNYKTFHATLREQEDTIGWIQNTNHYWQLAVEVSSRSFSDHKLPSNYKALLNNPDQARSLEAKVLYYNTSYLQQIQQENHEAAEKELRTLVTLLESHPARMDEEPGLYASTVNNLLSFLVFIGKYEDALQLIQKAKTMYEQWGITSENRTQLKQILRTYNIELEIYRDTKAWHDKAGFIARTEAFIEASEYKMPKEYRVSFWFQLASVHFLQKNFGRSMHWLNRLLNARFKGVRTDLLVQAHILNLMVHLEQKNMMVLRYYVDSTRRFMKKIREVQPYEDVLLKFFIRIGRLPLLEYKEAFAELKERLFPNQAEPLIPEGIRGYIDYEEWILGKMNLPVR